MEYLGTLAAISKRVATYDELGGGSGITRSVSIQTGSFTAGSAALTDYVYLCSGTVPTVTLPTAVGNTNRYTIKNTGAFIISLATTSSQTIDGSAPTFIAADGSSIDLISDGSNWFII